jgi:hypothetical protein
LTYNKNETVTFFVTASFFVFIFLACSAAVTKSTATKTSQMRDGGAFRFGSLIATIIFGILTAVKNDKKNNRLL